MKNKIIELFSALPILVRISKTELDRAFSSFPTIFLNIFLKISENFPTFFRMTDFGPYLENRAR